MGQGHARPLRAVKRCQLDGCNAKANVCTRCHTARRFCGRAHATEAYARLRRSRAITERPHVSRGGVSVLLNEEPSYGSLKRQFLSKWRNGANRVSVERIFMIETSKVLHHKYLDYGNGKNHTRHSFHGTSCSSTCGFFFFNVKGAPCTRRDCSVCSICTHGFQLKENAGRASRARNYKTRYGDGLYFSSMPSKANQYAVQSEKIKSGKKWRCMFAVTVIVGRAYRTKQGKLPANMSPPRGYDAVIAEVGPNLNHDEIVVYNDAAAIPTHLIVYSTV